MRFIWNLLAVIGLVIVVGGVAGAAYMMRSGALSGFDPQAMRVYSDLSTKILETGSMVDATVWKAKVAEGLSFEEVDQSIKTIANENNIKGVGTLPLYKQVEQMTGKKVRKIMIYMYCNPLTAVKMLDYSDAFAAYLPCRVSLIEDKTGQLWIYTLNMDPMIYGGKVLPPELKTEAIKVKKIMKDILDRASKGDF